MNEMNVKVIESENGKVAVLEDGSTHRIQVNDEGKEYFSVDNYYRDDYFKLFSGRIKDAIQVIKDGNGDALVVGGFFGRSESVHRFIDREYGEEVRKQTLDGFKDVEFGFSLKFGYMNSFSGSMFVSKNKDILGILSENAEYIYFDNQESADSYMKELLSDAQKVAEQYGEIHKTGDKEKISQFVQEHYNGDVVAHIWSSLAEPSDENKFKLEVVQVIKQAA